MEFTMVKPERVDAWPVADVVAINHIMDAIDEELAAAYQRGEFLINRRVRSLGIVDTDGETQWHTAGWLVRASDGWSVYTAMEFYDRIGRAAR